ncbi:MAG: efflux RND transporter periplasmic adaptor subunit [Planctomycetaceae bacterium]
MSARRLPARASAVAVVLAVAGAIAWGLAPRPVPVDGRPVVRGTLAVHVSDDGVTRIKERHVVRAPLAGRMRRVGVHPGDEVAAGTTVITTIDPPAPALLDPRTEADAAARVETAQAVLDLTEQALARARVQEEYTAADLARAKELFPTKAVTHEQLDAAERAWKTAVDDVAEAEQEIHVARHLVEVMEAAFVRSRPPRDGGPRPGTIDWRLDVTAPIDGRVLRVLREGEGLVEAGAELVEVGDPRDLEAVIDLVSEDAVRVQPGDRCEITGRGGAAPLAGRVRVVEPRGFTKVSPLGVEEQRVNVIVDLDVPPDERPALGDDFRVEATITIDEAHDAVLVPLAALFRRDGREAVFVVVDGRARLVPVTIGRRGDRDAEVLQGLAGGEQVIAYPPDGVADGTRVVTR